MILAMVTICKATSLFEVTDLQQERGMVKGGLFVKAEPIPISLNRTSVTNNFTSTNMPPSQRPPTTSPKSVSPSPSSPSPDINVISIAPISSPGLFNLSIEQGILPILRAIRTATLKLQIQKIKIQIQMWILFLKNKNTNTNMVHPLQHSTQAEIDFKIQM